MRVTAGTAHSPKLGGENRMQPVRIGAWPATVVSAGRVALRRRGQEPVCPPCPPTAAGSRRDFACPISFTSSRNRLDWVDRWTPSPKSLNSGASPIAPPATLQECKGGQRCPGGCAGCFCPQPGAAPGVVPRQNRRPSSREIEVLIALLLRGLQLASPCILRCEHLRSRLRAPFGGRGLDVRRRNPEA